MRKSTLLLIAIAAIAFAVASTDRAHAGEPTPTSDIVVVGLADSYTFGETASFSFRNDGTVPYDLGHQPQCRLLFEDDDTSRDFRIPANTHCDLVGENLLDPGETRLIVSGWSLDECTIPSFFCFGARPLESGDYTITGSFLSEDGTLEAEISETVSITGPTFTDDVALTFEANGQPSTHGSAPVSIKVVNTSNTTYTVTPYFGCQLMFSRPDGFLFEPPFYAGARCAPETPTALGPGASLTVVPVWNLDDCTEFGTDVCIVATPLSPGAYTVSGALTSGDSLYYAEFETTYTVDAATPVPTPSPAATPGDFPPTGGRADDSSGANLALFVAALGSVALAAAWVTRRLARG